MDIKREYGYDQVNGEFRILNPFKRILFSVTLEVVAQAAVAELNTQASEIERLKAQLADYQARYEAALLDGSEDTTAPGDSEPLDNSKQLPVDSKRYVVEPLSVIVGSGNFDTTEVLSIDVVEANKWIAQASRIKDTKTGLYQNLFGWTEQDHSAFIHRYEDAVKEAASLNAAADSELLDNSKQLPSTQSVLNNEHAKELADSVLQIHATARGRMFNAGITFSDYEETVSGARFISKLRLKHIDRELMKIGLIANGRELLEHDNTVTSVINIHGILNVDNDV